MYSVQCTTENHAVSYHDGEVDTPADAAEGVGGRAGVEAAVRLSEERQPQTSFSTPPVLQGPVQGSDSPLHLLVLRHRVTLPPHRGACQ